MSDLTTDDRDMVEPPAKRRRTFWIVVAIIAMLGAVFVVTRQTPPVEAPPAIKAAAISASGIIPATPEQLKQIRVESVREQLVDMNLEATGKVGFNEEHLTPVLAPFPGRVLDLLANRGDVVKAGQPLFVIESPDLVTAVNDLITAHSDIDRTKITLDIAQKSAERARRLYTQEALSTKDLQVAESDVARAQEDYRRAQSAVEVVRNRLVLLGKSAVEIAEIEKSYGQSPNANTGNSAAELDRRIVIRAPISGTIVDRKLGPGQYIKPDSPDPLFLISDLTTVWITVDIYENDLPRVRVGAPVTINVVGYPDKDFAAQISAISPTVDSSTRTVKVRCLVSNPSGLLKPEMFARVRVGESVKQDVVTVPSTAILTEGEHTFVIVEESAGRFRRREVRSGREIDGSTVVEEGLRANDRVVTSGVLLLASSEGNKP